jgi:ornithine carbamoyltransferase
MRLRSLESAYTYAHFSHVVLPQNHVTETTFGGPASVQRRQAANRRKALKAIAITS